MKISQASKLADNFTWQDAFNLLEKVIVECTDFERVSTVNKSLTKGTAFNIFLAPLADMGAEKMATKMPRLSAKNLLREFGEYGYLEEEPKPRKEQPTAHHEEPRDWPF